MSNLDKTVNAAQVPDAQGLIAMSRANDIRKLAISSGVDVVGIAPVERWDEFVPPGSRPYDMLPGAKSVVVVGVLGLYDDITEARNAETELARHREHLEELVHERTAA